VVEHNLAKVGVESSNLFARSSWNLKSPASAGLFAFWRHGPPEFAKVGVESLNLFARSSWNLKSPASAGFFAFWRSGCRNWRNRAPFRRDGAGIGHG
jgi:hypothetical protein